VPAAKVIKGKSTMERIIDSDGFNAVVKGRHGYVLYNKNDAYIGKAIEKYGEFSELEVRLFGQICKEGDIVIEAGANIGALTLPIARLVGKRGRVYAFEPQRIVFQTLCANMALNSIENVECHQLALSAQEGFVQIPDIRYDVAGNFGGVDVRRFKTGHKVRTARLDDVLDIPRLNLLKIDVEGMEHEVISGARTLIGKHKPALYVENDRQDKSQSLIELIWSLDYRLFWHTPPLFNPDNFARDPENAYPRIVSVTMFGLHKSAAANMKGFAEVGDSGFHPLRK
jgi:FkbM family methyltransferase